MRLTKIIPNRDCLNLHTATLRIGGPSHRYRKTINGIMMPAFNKRRIIKRSMLPKAGRRIPTALIIICGLRFLYMIGWKVKSLLGNLLLGVIAKILAVRIGIV